MTGCGDRDLLGLNEALGGIYALDRPVGRAPDRDDRAILDDVDAALGCSPCVTPSDSIMPRGASALLQRSAHHRITRIRRNVQRRTKFLGLLRVQPLVVDAVKTIGVDVALE